MQHHGFRKEAEHCYLLWCSGRQFVEGMLVELRMIKRQCLVGVLGHMMRPSSDQVIFQVGSCPGFGSRGSHRQLHAVAEVSALRPLLTLPLTEALTYKLDSASVDARRDGAYGVLPRFKEVNDPEAHQRLYRHCYLLRGAEESAG